MLAPLYKQTLHSIIDRYFGSCCASHQNFSAPPGSTLSAAGPQLCYFLPALYVHLILCCLSIAYLKLLLSFNFFTHHSIIWSSSLLIQQIVILYYYFHIFNFQQV